MNSPPLAPPNLHDIVLPEPVSWMPQTVGWWVLLAVTLLVLAWASLAAVRRRRANRYRRLALGRLARIEGALAEPESRLAALTELPVLVKQTALAFRPRSEVASLSGARWLRFLDESYGDVGFTEGSGRLLPTLAYGKLAQPVERVDDLVQLIRRWIRHHHSATPSPAPKELNVRV